MFVQFKGPKGGFSNGHGEAVFSPYASSASRGTYFPFFGMIESRGASRVLRFIHRNFHHVANRRVVRRFVIGTYREARFVRVVKVKGGSRVGRGVYVYQSSVLGTRKGRESRSVTRLSIVRGSLFSFLTGLPNGRVTNVGSVVHAFPRGFYFLAF